MIAVCLLFILIAWQTTWIERLGRLSLESLFLLSIAPVLIPYLTNHPSFEFDGESRPSWQLWFVRDATPYFEGSLLATVILFALTATVVSREKPVMAGDEESSREASTVLQHFTVATGIAIWTVVVSVLGKHPLAAFVGVLVVGYFWIRFQTASTARCSICCACLAVALGYVFGVLGPIIWRVVLSSWGFVFFAGGLGVLVAFCSREPDDPDGWHLALEGGKIGAIGALVGLGLSVTWTGFELAIDILLGNAVLPVKWVNLLTQAGLMAHDRFGLGYAVANAHEILTSAVWMGTEHVFALPHAWDDYLLLTLMEKFGWSAGAAVVLLLMAFLWLSYIGIHRLEKGFLKSFGFMLWGFLALACTINLQANFGILPGVPFLGLPFLSYHWFLAVLGGLITGLALRSISPSINPDASSVPLADLG